MAGQTTRSDPRAAQPNYRFWPQERVSLAGGLVDSIPAVAISEGETPACSNVDFDNGTVQTARGSLKFGNQVAPFSALRFTPDPAMAKLAIAAGKSVPLRSHLKLPYVEEHDIGGRFTFEGAFPGTDTYHARRGTDLEVSLSYRLPLSERLFTENTKGATAPTVPDPVYNPPHGFDEALDECHVIYGKGCDGNSPMSWALAVVNIGSQAAGGPAGLTAPAARASNYAFCFIWFDAAQWGELVPFNMRYALASGVNPSVAGTFSTQAFRAVIFHKFVEPGRIYNLALQVKLDTGSPGGVAVNTAWNNDGYVKFWCAEDGGDVTLVGSFVDSALGGTAAGIDVYKGPADSLRYLSKYGVRYAGRDPMDVGVGMRSLPWQTAGFIPWGADAAPLENGGWRMIDRSSTLVADLYGVGIYTLTCFKNANADAFLRVNHAGLSNGNTNGGVDPMATHGGAAYGNWNGLGAGITANFNAEALRGYRLVTTADFNIGAPNSKGAIFSILSYAENAGNHEVTVLNGSTINAFGAVGNQKFVVIQAFRWFQREIEVGDIRIWSAPRAYDDVDAILAARRKWSLKHSLDLDDATEPDLPTLLAYWPCDDGGGRVVREKVFGRWRNGQLGPFGAGLTDGGSRGKQMLYLSGEGEALVLDLSTDPVAKRELAAMLRGDQQGFGVELTCVFTEAMYAIMSPTTAELLPDGGGLIGNRPRFVPDIVNWDVRSPETSGLATRPKPILNLSFRALRSDPANPASYQRPAGFGLEIGVKGDQQDVGNIVHSDLLPWFLSGAVNVSRYDLDAAWVGKLITIQVGVQYAGTPGLYTAFIALHPKQSLQPASADPGDAEFAYRTTGGGTYDFSGTYYQAATIRIDPKDLERSIITIGGGWQPRGLGYRELNCPMLIDEVRIFGTAPPGALPATNGGVLTSRDGKLEGLKCLPPRLLALDDILQLPGANLAAANVTASSPTVTPAGSGRFFTDQPAATRDSVLGAYFQPRGDVFDQPNPERPSVQREEFYHVRAVAADGSSLTVDTPVNAGTRRNAGSRVFRLLGYTAFEDDIGDRELPVASGPAYVPATATTADAILTEEFFENIAPTASGFRFRIYGPGVASPLPQWVRGHVSPRRLKPEDGILGIASVNDTIYAAVRGALYEGDDRWRPDGPDARVTRSLAFRAKPTRAIEIDVSVPLQEDRLEFAVPQGLTFTPDPLHVYATRYDAWIALDALCEYQTVFWIGDTHTDPQKLAGTHKVHATSRVARGRPEFVFGSTAVAAGAVTPEKGLWIATASVTLDELEFNHVRWVLATRSSGGVSVLLKPYCLVNGKPVKVAVNAVENNAAITTATDWMRTSTIVQPGPTAVALVGVARDSYLAPVQSVALASVGAQLRPQRVQGYLHGLGGKLAELVATTVAAPVGTPAAFDPHTLTYSDAINTLFSILGVNAAGVGAKVKDVAMDQYGVVRSHPFISVWHQFGRSDDMVSFARFGQQLYAVNGERVVLINDSEGRFAGALPPESELDFTLERLPIWMSNVRGPVNGDNDPVQTAPRGSALQFNHYKASGNNYLKQALSGADATAMAWISGGYFHFKHLWRPASVSGRVPIWRKALSKESGGPFVECRDGVLYIGWYDTLLKLPVDVHSDAIVFAPGELYDVNVRMQWPPRDAVEGNWPNSYYTDGRIRFAPFSAAAGTFVVGETLTWPPAGANHGIVTKQYGAGSLTGVEFVLTAGVSPVVGNVITGSVSGATGTTAASASVIRPMKNLAIVRQFRRTAPLAAGGKDGPLDAFVTATALADPWSRNCISFTTLAGPTGCTATGMVTPPGATFTGGPVGQVTAGLSAGAPAQAWGAVPAGGRFFHPDMCGMLFQFANGAFIGKVYRLISLTSGLIANVTELDGTVPDLTGPINVLGGVFAGTALVKSPEFDSSASPDTGTYDIEYLGSAQAADILSGIAPHEGKAWSPGWGITTPAVAGTDARCFETLDTSKASAAPAGTDPIQVGTDKFAFQNFDSAGDVGPLRYDLLTQFYCADGQTYTAAGWASNVTTQPNEPRQVAKDPHVPNAAPTCTAASPGAGLPTWEYVQAPATWAAKRFFAVAFFDEDQNLVSNPGPILTVQPAGEDKTNPSGTVRALLKRLPTAPTGVNAELWIFESVSGGSSAALFRVVRVPNLTSETSVEQVEQRIQEGVVLVQDNGEPPECRILANSNGRIVAAALTALDQLDALVPSKPQSPAQFAYAATERLNTGPGDAVTGLLELDGLLLAMKREGVFSITFDDTGGIVAEIVTSGAGCIAHQSLLAIDGRAIWRGDKGLFHAARGQSASDLASVRWLSSKLRRFFEEEVDHAAASRTSACQVGLRAQYLAALKLADTPYQRERISAEGDVFSRYRDPNVTALAAVRDRAGGIARVVAGTQEGFLVWMDREDGQLVLMGADEDTDGSTVFLVANAGSTLNAILVGSGVVDQELEGLRGVPVRYRVGDVTHTRPDGTTFRYGGTEYVATVLGCEGGILHLDRPLAVLPEAESTATLGALLHEWRTKMSDLGNFEKVKSVDRLDIEFAEGSSGRFRVEFFKDRDQVAVQKVEGNLLVASRIVSVPVAISAKHVQARVTSEPLTAGGAWEIVSVLWRTKETDLT